MIWKYGLWLHDEHEVGTCDQDRFVKRLRYCSLRSTFPLAFICEVMKLFQGNSVLLTLPAVGLRFLSTLLIG